MNKNLSFSPQDREENIRRISEVAKLFADAGIVVLTSFISPYERVGPVTIIMVLLSITCNRTGQGRGHCMRSLACHSSKYLLILHLLSVSNVMSKVFTRKLGLALLKVFVHKGLFCVVRFILLVGFTGIDSSYDAPSNPDLILKAGELSLDECVQCVLSMLTDKVY